MTAMHLPGRCCQATTNKGGMVMMGRMKQKRLLLATLIMFCVSPVVSRSADNVAIQWRFDTEGDLRGWAVGGHIRDT